MLEYDSYTIILFLFARRETAIYSVALKHYNWAIFYHKTSVKTEFSINVVQFCLLSNRTPVTDIIQLINTRLQFQESCARLGSCNIVTW